MTATDMLHLGAERARFVTLRRWLQPGSHRALAERREAEPAAEFDGRRRPAELRPMPRSPTHPTFAGHSLGAWGMATTSPVPHQAVLGSRRSMKRCRRCF